MKRPNFFILGAPKCGTTALSEWLRQHPQVFFSPKKEPHFFNVDGRVSTGTLREYEALFAAADDRHGAVGEGSTRYLFSSEAVQRILEYQPQARFIVCLRNPLEMASSLHGERIKQGDETERSFETAWRLQAARAAGRGVPRTVRCDPGRVQYGRYCLLGEQLGRVIEQAGSDRVLPLLLDDTRDDPRAQYRRVLAFLGLEDDGRSQFSTINASRFTRSTHVAQLGRAASNLKARLGLERQIGVLRVLERLNTKATAEKEALVEPFRTELIGFFLGDVQKLAALLDRDLSSWLGKAQ